MKLRNFDITVKSKVWAVVTTVVVLVVTCSDSLIGTKASGMISFVYNISVGATIFYCSRKSLKIVREDEEQAE